MKMYEKFMSKKEFNKKETLKTYDLAVAEAVKLKDAKALKALAVRYAERVWPVAKKVKVKKTDEE